MQSMQRSIGRMIQKSPGDNAKTAVLLKDYDDAEQLLAKLAEQVGSWRAAWVALAHAQLGIVTELESLYDPIVGAADENDRPHSATPELLLERTLKLKEAYNDLKTDLLEEIEVVDAKIVKPVSEARESIVPVQKTIKKREKLRLDYENVQTDVTKLQRKAGRSPKDEKALAKAEAELGPRSDAFHEVDTRLKEILPPMIAATFSILPPVLASLVMIQNRLLGMYYTTLHTYCEDYHFPLPPPGMDNVVEMWTSDHDPIKSQIEALSCVVAGRRARMVSGQSSSDSTALTTSRRPIAPAYTASENNMRKTSSSSLISSNRIAAPAAPKPNLANKPSFSSGMATDFTTASRLGETAAGRGGSPSSTTNVLTPVTSRTYSSGGGAVGGDYFGRTPASQSGTGHNSIATTPMTSSTVSSSQASAAAAKKKPPPPPPPSKPKPRAVPPAEYVIALYDFSGQGSGDLSFSEGDRIKIVKKTATDQDWWEGEVGGVAGSFPANYCRPE